MTNVKTNSPRAWILAARPKTLTGAAVPVMIGASYALKTSGWHEFRALPALLCMLFAFMMQIDANLVNDYFDFLKGNDDTTTRIGPRRACSEGWITVRAMRLGIIITSIVSALLGLPLILFGGWEMIPVGALCLLFCFLYTTKLSYLGLGDVLVLIFFGVVPVCLTAYVSSRILSMEILLSSIACGMVIDTLLVVNNYRDRDNDRRDGKKTLVVRIGSRPAEQLYLWLGLVASIIQAIIIADIKATALVVYATLHIATYRQMCATNHGKQLNRILGITARNIFIYGIVVSAIIILT